MWTKILPDPVLAALKSRRPFEGDIWLVGGAVRDHFLEQKTADFDFAVSQGSRRLARQMADSLGAAYFDLDSERDTGRVVATSSDRLWRSLDFARLRADSIQEDLELRDFTINALAIPIESGAILLDPTSGLADIHRGILRLCRHDGLERDPIRAIRAVRLAADLDFKIEPELVKKILSIGPGLSTISIERIRAELFRMLDQERPAKALRIASQLDLNSTLLPKLNDEQLWRGFARQDHLARLMAAVVGDHQEAATGDWVTGQTSVRLGRFRDRLAADLSEELAGGRNRRQLLFWASMYIPEHFPAAYIGARLKELRLSRIEISAAVKLAKAWHQWGHNPLAAAEDRRSRFRYFQALDAAGVDMILLSLADSLTKDPGPPKETSWEQEVERARALLSAWYEGPTEMLDPTPLLRGDDLMEYLDVPAGPTVGKLLSRIKEEQAAGQIMTRQEALDLAARLLTGSS